jgi:hypothetical protein
VGAFFVFVTVVSWKPTLRGWLINPQVKYRKNDTEKSPVFFTFVSPFFHMKSVCGIFSIDNVP